MRATFYLLSLFFGVKAKKNDLLCTRKCKFINKFLYLTKTLELCQKFHQK